MEQQIPKVRIRGGKNKFCTRDSYRTYLVMCDKPVKVEIYVDIVNMFFKFLMELIMSGEHIKLPYRTGEVLIRGKKQKIRVVEGEIKGAAPDWVRTKALWARNPEAKEQKKLIYHLNEHTQGMRYRITWLKKTMKAINQSIYSLRFTRTNKREVNKEIINGKEYIEKH